MNRSVQILLIGVLTLVVSALLGGGLAIYNIKNAAGSADFMESNGQWRVNPVMDLKDHKQRALIALTGLFALRESEVVYFFAGTDDEGEPLSSEHTYVLSGSVPDARYWSYTLYGSDDFLIPNPEKKYSYNAENLQFIERDTLNPELENTQKAAYNITISKDRNTENWLPSGDNEQLGIILRLYNPSPYVYNNLTSIPLPKIKKVK